MFQPLNSTKYIYNGHDYVQDVMILSDKEYIRSK